MTLLRSISDAQMEKLFDVIHEDAELLVINKPAGLVCHPTKHGELSSLIGRARLHLGDGARPHLVNRLDRETSGIVIVAKSSVVAGELGKMLEGRELEKKYLAIVHGHLREEHGAIDAPLGKDNDSRVAVKDCVRSDGVSSQTEFQVARRFSRAEGDFTLLRVMPRTGRKHQIRIHLAHVGHPVVGDKLYGGDEDLYLALVENRLNETQLQRLILPHHALHAEKVTFNWRDIKVEFCARPEKEFVNFLNQAFLA